MFDREWFRSLSPEGRSLALHAAFGPASTPLPGLARAGAGALLDLLPWLNREGLDRAAAELSERAAAVVDFAARIVFIPGVLAEDIPDNFNIIVAWRKALAEVPECAATARIDAYVRGHIQSHRPDWIDRWGAPREGSRRVSETIPEGSGRVPATITDPEAEAGTEAEQKQSRAEAPGSAGSARQQAENLMQLWNEITTAPIPRCMTMTPKRQSHGRARLADVGADKLAEAMRKIEGSAFCRGQNDRQWVATLDWLLGAPDVAVKVLEGKYDDREAVSKARPVVPGRVSAAPGKYAHLSAESQDALLARIARLRGVTTAQNEIIQ